MSTQASSGAPRPVAAPDLDLHELRQAIQAEYAEVAQHPTKGFHFHTGRPLARLLGYDDAWLEGIPEGAIESFAGTGNPFSLGAAEWRARGRYRQRGGDRQPDRCEDGRAARAGRGRGHDARDAGKSAPQRRRDRPDERWIP